MTVKEFNKIHRDTMKTLGEIEKILCFAADAIPELPKNTKNGYKLSSKQCDKIKKNYKKLLNVIDKW